MEKSGPQRTLQKLYLCCCRTDGASPSSREAPEEVLFINLTWTGKDGANRFPAQQQRYPAGTPMEQQHDRQQLQQIIEQCRS